MVDAGYRTGYFGKWHIERDNAPGRFGWQVNGVRGGALHNELVAEVLGGKPLRPECDPAHYLEAPHGYGPHLFYGVTDRPAEERNMGLTTTLALRYLREVVQGDDPWCTFVSFEEPHDPFIASREFYDRYAEQELPPPPNADDD
ncbi:MAG: sulfatase-like hydrolase/transferase, partial [Gemmatimonadetes bacterium]|nr:sulfatase-like hydrolase/transferase [Gemmatimonadota bacterium]